MPGLDRIARVAPLLLLAATAGAGFDRSAAVVAADNGSNVVARIGGAGQRLHFSFGGELSLRANNQLAGDYVVVLAPQAPVGSMLAIMCRYRQFSDARLDNGNQLRFTGRGQCTRLALNGAVTQFNTVNDFTLVDNGAANDEIGMTMQGSTGISLPQGTLSHGDLTIQTSP